MLAMRIRRWCCDCGGSTRCDEDATIRPRPNEAPMKASLAAFLLVVASHASQATTATIEGIAQHVTISEVIAGARVTLMHLVRVSNEFGGAEQAGTTVTDSQGR